MYSNWDMVTLTGEKVDLHIMTQPPLGEWVYFGTEVTNSSGWIQYIIPESRHSNYFCYTYFKELMNMAKTKTKFLINIQGMIIL